MKYRITIENLETGKVEQPKECNGYGMLLDRGEDFSALINGISEPDLATMIASHKDFRAAAIIGLAIYRAHREDVQPNPLVAIVRAIREEDD